MLNLGYHEALKVQFTSKKREFCEKIVKEFLQFWMDSPPEHLRRRSVVTGKTCRQDLEQAANCVFDKAVRLDKPGAKKIYRDLSIEDLRNEDLMASLRELMEQAMYKGRVDPATIENLFRTDDVVAAQDSSI